MLLFDQILMKHIACIHLIPHIILGKSVVHVRALTYCDIHTINVEKLKEVNIYRQRSKEWS